MTGGEALKLTPMRASGDDSHGTGQADFRTAGLFALRSAELIQGFLMQDPNLSQVCLRFFDVLPDDLELFLDGNVARMSQRGFQALDAKCSTGCKGISLLYSAAG